MILKELERHLLKQYNFDLPSNNNVDNDFVDDNHDIDFVDDNNNDDNKNNDNENDFVVVDGNNDAADLVDFKRARAPSAETIPFGRANR